MGSETKYKMKTFEDSTGLIKIHLSDEKERYQLYASDSKSNHSYLNLSKEQYQIIEKVLNDLMSDRNKLVAIQDQHDFSQ